jgi:hypothetical protein
MHAFTFLILGYLATIAVETPVLVFGLSSRHSLRTKLFAGWWLTACTYPIVILALPALTGNTYTLVAETFAPLAEALLFLWIVPDASPRDLAAVVGANVASFLAGVLFLG